MHIPNIDTGDYCDWPVPYFPRKTGSSITTSLPRITTKNRYCMLRFDALP